MGDTGDAPLETAARRNGLVSGARPRSRPLPRRAADRRTWQRAKRKAPRTPARGGYGRAVSAATPRTSSIPDHLYVVGVRFGGSEHRKDPGNDPPARSHFGGHLEPAPVEIQRAPARATGEPAHLGGRTTGPTESASSGFGRKGFRISFGWNGRYPPGFRRLRPPGTMASATALREEARHLLPGVPTPPSFFGREVARVDTAQAGAPAAKDANELVRDVPRKPGQPERSDQEDGRKRQGGNGRSDAETAADEGNSS